MRSILTMTAGLAVAAMLATPAAPQTSGSDHPDLPPGPGRDTLLRVCSSCHDPDIVAHQNLDAKGWKDTVGAMAASGATATDAELAQITDYLVKSFPPKGGDTAPPQGAPKR